MNVSIRNIMSTKLKTLHPKDRLSTAKELFDQFDIHHIPVQVMGDIRGIISLGDLIYLEGVATNSFDEFIQTKKLALTTVDAIMTQRPICAEASMLLSEVLEIMTENRINALPVIENDELVGIVTSFDVMTYLKDHLN